MLPCAHKRLCGACRFWLANSTARPNFFCSGHSGCLCRPIIIAILVRDEDGVGVWRKRHGEFHDIRKLGREFSGWEAGKEVVGGRSLLWRVAEAGAALASPLRLPLFRSGVLSGRLFAEHKARRHVRYMGSMAGGQAGRGFPQTVTPLYKLLGFG